jgi:putative lipoic acid-binding regulatory protein
MDKGSLQAFKEKLDQHYAWPVLYVFKFIVPKEQEVTLRDLFPTQSVTEKSSANGNYTSFTIQMMCPSSDVVIEVYEKVENIEGLIAL